MSQFKAPSLDPSSSLPNTHSSNIPKPSPGHYPSNQSYLLQGFAARLPRRAPLPPASTHPPTVPPTPTQPTINNTHRPPPSYSLPPPPASVYLASDPAISEPVPLYPIIHPHHRPRPPKKKKPSERPSPDPSRPSSVRTVEIRGIYEGKHSDLTMGVIRGGALESIELEKEEGRNVCAVCLSLSPRPPTRSRVSLPLSSRIVNTDYDTQWFPN